MILSGRVVSTSKTRIYCGLNVLNDLRKLVSSYDYRASRVIILADTNTARHCLPVLVSSCPELDSASMFEIDPGEASKSLAVAEKIWNELLLSGADRHTLLINLGGGVVSDLGGFVAAGYKRGITYVNVPTSLMGMADASIGGKTAVNLSQMKNQVGFFYSPAAVFIDPVFLKTLPEAHLRSGFAEIVKSALIGDPVLWRRILRLGAEAILSTGTSEKLWQDLVLKTVTFKNRIACQDFREKKLRKILNFGHTVGHALESLSSGHAKTALLHGDAVALGMIAETRLSQMKAGLSETEAGMIESFLRDAWADRVMMMKDLQGRGDISIESISKLLVHDKKNKGGKISFTLLKEIGKPGVNIEAGPDEITASLEKLFE
jgi:3-dehydroquinate synthase